MRKSWRRLLAGLVGFCLTVAVVHRLVDQPPVASPGASSSTAARNHSRAETVQLSGPEREYRQFLLAYSSRHNRSPPLNIRDWFNYAQAHKCSLDAAAYDQIYRNLAPFRSAHLACVSSGECKQSDPVISRAMIQSALDLPAVGKVMFSKGKLVDKGGYFDTFMEALFQDPSVMSWMPDVTFGISLFDEPRVLKQKPPTTGNYQNIKFDGHHHWTHSNYRDLKDMMSQVCDRASTHVLDSHGFFMGPERFDASDELIPVFSSSTISGCFADIVIPAIYHFGSSIDTTWTSPAWSDKRAVVHWRGSPTGGHASITDNEYMKFHRQRLVLAAQSLKVSGLEVDIKLTQVVQCEEDACEDEKKKMPPAPGASHSQAAAFKYLVDIDGNTYSQRILPFLRQTRSLVVKMAVFEDWVTAQIVPNVHYLPARLDLTDFERQLKWARDNDDEARKIALAGHQFALERLRREDMLCYMLRLVLEYHHLTVPSNSPPPASKSGKLANNR